MIDKIKLETICDAIETRLNQLGLPVIATGGKVYPQAGFVELVISPIAIKGKSPKIDAILNAQADIANAVKNNNVRVFQDSKAQITIEIQVAQAVPPNIEDLVKNTRKYQLVLGKDRVGTPLIFDLNSSANAHLLISGTTGSGKTALAHSILLGACMKHSPEDLKIVIIDHNNTEADWFYPNIESHLAVAPPENIGEAEALLAQIANKMLSSNNPYKTIVFIDELAGICSESPEALRAIEVITQQGRKYGVHMIACTQKPSAVAIGGLMKANMRRAVGKVASPEDSKVASGIAGVGAESLQGFGQFIFVDTDNIRFQSALPVGYGDRRPPEATNRAGSMFDFAILPKPKPGITVEGIAKALAQIDASGKKLIRKTVLETMGYEQAGGAARKVNELWDEALVCYNDSKFGTLATNSPDLITGAD